MVSLEKRFWSKVECGTDDECWNWLGNKLPSGHARFGLRHGVIVLAHRFAYELKYGNIPKGEELHHKCENPSCVNPYHLIVVTRKEHTVLSPNNISYPNIGKIHCMHGHEFNVKNTRVLANGKRQCRKCDLLRHYKRKEW